MITVVNSNTDLFDAGCVFCRMKCDPDLSNEPTNELLYSGEFHYVVCGLGAWTPGYVLLVTHLHFDNFSLSPDECQPEFNSLFGSIERLFMNEFGEVTIFEHGAIDDKQTAGGCINHAHIHFIAKSVDLCGELKQQFHQISVPGGAPSDRRHLPPQRTPYLYVKQKDEGSRVFLVDRSLPTQFLRQRVASKIEMHTYWDYKLYPFNENVMKTIEILRGKIK
jgi:diadenosine tetraphosphate (Ap4A) HIT family hydrolase